MDNELHTKAFEEVYQNVTELKKQIDQLQIVAQYHAAKAGISLRRNGDPVQTSVGVS